MAFFGHFLAFLAFLGLKKRFKGVVTVQESIIRNRRLQFGMKIFISV